MGEIIGGTGFGDGAAVCVKFMIEAGDRWDWLEGARAGQTHTCAPEAGSPLAVWAHPLDVHYAVGSMHDWPRLLVQVCQQDVYGRLEVVGYGNMAIPAAPGSHEVSCPCWRPVGSASEEFSAFFLGGYPVLKSTALLHSSASDRFRIVTTSTGSVHVRFDVLFRYMDQYGVEW